MTLPANGTLTLGRDVMRHLGAKGGDAILIEKLPANSLAKASQSRSLDIMDLAGCLKTDIHLSLEEIETAIIEGYAEGNVGGARS